MTNHTQDESTDNYWREYAKSRYHMLFSASTEAAERARKVVGLPTVWSWEDTDVDVIRRLASQCLTEACRLEHENKIDALLHTLKQCVGRTIVDVSMDQLYCFTIELDDGSTLMVDAMYDHVSGGTEIELELK